jgi:hypothetical protein
MKTIVTRWKISRERRLGNCLLAPSETARRVASGGLAREARYAADDAELSGVCAFEELIDDPSTTGQRPRSPVDDAVDDGDDESDDDDEGV